MAGMWNSFTAEYQPVSVSDLCYNPQEPTGIVGSLLFNLQLSLATEVFTK